LEFWPSAPTIGTDFDDLAGDPGALERHAKRHPGHAGADDQYILNGVHPARMPPHFSRAKAGSACAVVAVEVPPRRAGRLPKVRKRPVFAPAAGFATGFAATKSYISWRRLNDRRSDQYFVLI
jgi:hypothetical protein